jgi:hypothetical protein
MKIQTPLDPGLRRDDSFECPEKTQATATTIP